MRPPMRTVILLRHAKAEREAATGEDFDRALTERGWADARLIGRVLADAGFAPDRALVSASVRASQTWEAVATAFPPAETTPLRSLFNAGPERLLAEIEAAHDAETVIVVAHNPGLHILSARWARGSGAPGATKVDAGFPTAAAAVFRWEEGQAAPALEGFFAPSAFGGGAHGA